MLKVEGKKCLPDVGKKISKKKKKKSRGEGKEKETGGAERRAKTSFKNSKKRGQRMTDDSDLPLERRILTRLKTGPYSKWGA